MKADLSLELARQVSARAQAAWADGSMLQAVTP